MPKKPYVLVKCAISLDGYIDDNSNERLILSDEKDFKRVDEERSKYDAILIGAETLRKDNPGLIIKSDGLINKRLSAGKNKHPIKVTITASGNLNKDAKFFNVGETSNIIYCPDNVKSTLLEKLNEKAEIISANSSNIEPEFILEDLYKRGVKKLMIEGGSSIITMFLSKNLVDELQVSIAPFFVGDSRAPKFVNSESFPYNKYNRMKLVNAEIIGDMVLITYKLS